MVFNSNRDLIKSYQNTFTKFGNSPAAVQWPKGRQNLRFKLLTSHLDLKKKFSILDYGCGLGHLNKFLEEEGYIYDYLGVDIVPEFIKNIKKTNPKVKSRLIDSYEDLDDKFDNIIISGTFNIIVGKNKSEYLDYVKKTLLHLFKITKCSLAVNFLTDKVDFMQADSFHVNMFQMGKYISENLSPRFLTNASYMPYEFSLVVFKDCEIIRPENIYRVY